MSENMEEKIQKASTTLATMLDYLGLDATIKSKEKNGRIYLTAVSEDAGRIIGRRGKTLEDLQLLINKMIQKGDEMGPKIVIDVDGYSRKPGPGRREEREPREGGAAEEGAGATSEEGDRRPERRGHFEGGRGERRSDRRGGHFGRDRDRDGGGRGERRHDRRGGHFGRDRDRDGGGHRRFSRDDERAPSEEEREEQVKLQALDAAKEVKKWGEPVTLPPMNSKDRRTVHIALQDDPEIATESKEDGDSASHKSVVISLKSK